MKNYQEWEFLLDGCTQEFRHFSILPGTRFFSIYGGIDHYHDCPNDDFRMQTVFVEGEDDPELVWQVGHELISLYNGASRLYARDHLSASIYEIRKTDRSVPHSPPSGTFGLLGTPQAFSREVLRDLEDGGATHPKFRFIHFATELMDVYLILKYLDMEANWSTYYKMMETIKEVAKLHKVELYFDEKEKDAFHNTANNFSIAGFDARHGFKHNVKANKTAKMDLSDGYTFVVNMAKEYFCKAELERRYAKAVSARLEKPSIDATST
ncbi:hypothetical protein [Cupriavidus oxalaticus]|uniref:Uncharacterized protein n=1 Tax=Cupriavidus oxalaticus TaxID=96344 RepID=A0A5P3VQW2_9BURK|nr:hypothetical protein [Cupriavidus oxalaticus]QEZ48756.1 hypothetical protein D2917_31220 [Cupriavidus oxalaticus]